MDKRGYKHDLTNYKEYFKGITSTGNVVPKNCFREKMDYRYLRECLYNLEEKAICGGISKAEWKLIYEKYKNNFELWDGEDNEG